MFLQLDEKFRVLSDSSKQNFILEKLEDVTIRGTDETKQEWINKGYFGGSFNSLLKRYVNEHLMDTDAKSINELTEILKQLDTTIEKVVKQQNIKLVNGNE